MEEEKQQTAIQHQMQYQMQYLLPPILDQLTIRQIAVALALRETDSAAAACRHARVARRQYYNWSVETRALITRAAQLMRYDGILAAQHILRYSVAEAALVKANGLRHKDPKIAQAAATEILDRLLGKAVQPLLGAIVARRLEDMSDDELAAILLSEASDKEDDLNRDNDNDNEDEDENE